uniref:Uncharacterized protein n=1 Tax=Arion vulgaris TaxID=1028688 RepID=A0A0B7BLB2_9EUPU
MHIVLDCTRDTLIVKVRYMLDILSLRSRHEIVQTICAGYCESKTFTAQEY